VCRRRWIVPRVADTDEFRAMTESASRFGGNRLKGAENDIASTNQGRQRHIRDRDDSDHVWTLEEVFGVMSLHLCFVVGMPRVAWVGRCLNTSTAGSQQELLIAACPRRGR